MTHNEGEGDWILKSHTNAILSQGGRQYCPGAVRSRGSTVQRQHYYSVRSIGSTVQNIDSTIMPYVPVAANQYNAVVSGLHNDYLSSHLCGLLAVGIFKGLVLVRATAEKQQ